MISQRAEGLTFQVIRRTTVNRITEYGSKHILECSNKFNII